MIPTRKVSTGALAGAILATGLWVVKLITGKEVAISPTELVAAQTVIVFLLQYQVADADQSSQQSSSVE